MKRGTMFSTQGIKWLVLIVLGLSFLTLSLASACMVPDGAPQAADCCVLPCKAVSSPEMAKSYCDLSNQQRSLHAGPQLHGSVILVEDGLSLIADSLKAPPSFTSLRNLNTPQKSSHEDLCLLHRTFLI